MEEDAEESEVANAEKHALPLDQGRVKRKKQNSEETPLPQANKIWTSWRAASCHRNTALRVVKKLSKGVG